MQQLNTEAEKDTMKVGELPLIREGDRRTQADPMWLVVRVKIPKFKVCGSGWGFLLPDSKEISGEVG
jgi:hypothetical protein